MDNFSISNDIIPVGEFKVNLSKWLKNVQNTRHPLVITQNGRPAGILISPLEYDELISKKSFIDSVNRGLSDYNKGDTYNTEKLKDELHKKRSLRDSK